MLNFRRKQIVAQNQIEKMVKAKAELECTVTEKEQQLHVIREKLHMKNIHYEDQSHYLNDSTASIRYQHDKFQQNAPQTAAEVQAGESLSNEVSEMIIIDSKDPDRPRFTLKELQKVLMEKNQLTVKLDQTKDELEQLRKQ